MIDYQELYQQLQENELESWVEALPDILQGCFDTTRHGDIPKWFAALDALPKLTTEQVALDKDTIEIGRPGECDTACQAAITASLHILHPWRKGPFNIHGVFIDTEWRSDWKWQRLQGHIAPLTDRKVLDIGCGSGYHCWRMAGEGARLVIGIDPTLLYVMQFYAIKHFIANKPPVHVLPLGIEQLPPSQGLFDSVFSMGVFYHRRSPFDHLFELRELLRPGGELILETLVIEGGEGEVLVPKGRYAQMRNVWFLPSCDTLLAWMRRAGYQNARVVDVTETSIKEQRSTEWMQFDSLPQFLDPEDQHKTIEGYPAPRRAIVVANAP